MHASRSAPPTDTPSGRRGRRRLAHPLGVLAGAVGLGLTLAPVAVPLTAVPAGAAPHGPATTYQLSLGDSLAAGTGASVPAKNYVNLIAAHETAALPGLTV